MTQRLAGSALPGARDLQPVRRSLAVVGSAATSMAKSEAAPLRRVISPSVIMAQMADYDGTGQDVRARHMALVLPSDR